ncbi:MAG: tail fiber domain-containing protein [Candidatus Liptonbacteria bacterium]|nr:tail fiber domain-containing protein [Candidatus Liptonbacteria bacterium]
MRKVFSLKFILVAPFFLLAFFYAFHLARGFTGPSSSAGVGSGVISSLNGNIGIGTATPGALLHLLGASPYLRLDCTSANCGAFELRVDTSGGSKYFAVYDVNNSTQPFTILNSGNIGIGTTTPAYPLSVAGAVYSSSGGFRFPDGTTQTTAASGGATVNASNVTAGVFASGNFSFPSSLGIATTTQVSLPQALSVYGGGYFSGNVGIGTTAPGAKLHIYDPVGSSADAWLKIESDSASSDARLDFDGATGRDGIIRFLQTGTIEARIDYDSATGDLIFSKGSAVGSNLVIDTSGNVGIGTTSPSYKLHVAGDVGATAFYYTSDARLKADIRPTGGLEIISGLRGVTFSWKNSGKRSAGFIAQEVEQVLPEAVSTDSATGLKSLNYGALSAPIVEAIKELERDSEAKGQKIAELEREIEELKQVPGR